MKLWIVVSSVLAHAGLRREELRTVAEDSVQMEVFQIEKNIRGLLVVATVSPLVGVLGTIQGLVGFYSQPGVLAVSYTHLDVYKRQS